MCKFLARVTLPGQAIQLPGRLRKSPFNIVPCQDRHAEKVVYRNIKALDLRRMQVHGQHPVAPCVVIKSATSLAVIGSRAFTLRSCLA